MSIPSIFSLIDTLCIFLCGGVITGVLSKCDSLRSCVDDIMPKSESLNMIATIFICYLVGLMFHRIVEFLSYRFFRRSPRMMSYALSEYLKEQHNLLEHECMIADLLEKLTEPLSVYRHVPFDNIKSLYDECYIEICKNQMIGDIKVMEGQAAFVRNCIVLFLFIYLPKLICTCCGHLCFCWFVNHIAVFFILGALVVLWYNIQMKQYKMVWDYAYLLKKERFNEYERILKSSK